MNSAVSFQEAVEILHWIGTAPGSVRSIRDFDAGSFGPQPFFVDWKGDQAEVMLVFTGGVITGVASIRVGSRFSNEHDWIGEAQGGPLDELSEISADLLELSLRSAADR